MQTRVSTLAQWKQEGHKWAMLTAYDYSTARAFAEAEIPVLLVGDSAANVVYGYDTTTQVSLDEMIFLTRSVVRGAPQALVVADLPFGTYEASDEQAIMTSSRVMRESGAQMVKLEGGVRMADRIRALVKAGIPVMAHIGFTPQSVHKLGGFKVQGRGDSAQQLIEDALAVQEAGASAVVLEMVPRDLAKEVTEKLDIPTVGIGAGPDTDAQVLVWYDAMAVPQDGRRPRFVKVFAEVGEAMTEAARTYRQEVEAGQFPSDEHCF
ncbi:MULTISPECIES: 3-methyl-2-oxobutanoate hydroxymethyltransferase [Lawsonella]|jgi:3-methyl-2-oxobutanoate hydroxymethyltransferase|uniref:3-methyl-2-oxobutanoate hydroxymethyltransferase n=1 Tax=Lawsonella clevelandensis TaxID=1528099 RepID=A0A2W5I9I8_9ACTN|nr:MULTISPECIES: 3-methyl-2-oxobutanoate hydroxymethyltransferase [Lawsonella]PZP88771.1 MAG: 3-methyl-2-oxobutanoate hydroxymethyltransferase [Lawsonella clevelandensis]